jgi:hypothetical protein
MLVEAYHLVMLTLWAVAGLMPLSCEFLNMFGLWILLGAGLIVAFEWGELCCLVGLVSGVGWLNGYWWYLWYTGTIGTSEAEG